MQRIFLALLLGPLILGLPAKAQSENSSLSDLATKELSPSAVKDIVDSVLERRLQQELRGLVNEEVNKQVQSFQWILAILGLGGITLVVSLVNKTLEDMVTQKIEERTNNITQGLDFLKFTTAATKINIILDTASAIHSSEMTNRIPESDLQAIISYLRTIDPKSPFRHSPEFLSGLLVTMRLLTIQTRSADIDELFDKYEAEIYQDANLLIRLLDHYGQDIIGDGTPKGEDTRSFKRFLILEGYATSKRYPELALAYRTMYESEKARLNPRLPSHAPSHAEDVAACIRRSRNLVQKEERPDQELYLRKLLTFTRASNWFQGFQGQNIEVAAKYLFSSQQDAFLEVYGLGKADSERIGTDGINREEALALARTLTRGS